MIRALALSEDRPFLLDSKGGRSRHEVSRGATQLAAKLDSLDLGKGARVAILLADASDAVVALFAVLLTGYVAVPLPPRAPAGENRRILDDCGATAIISDQTKAPELALDKDGPLLVEMPGTGDEGNEIQFDQPNDPEALALILFTSGTTGSPKGVMLTHGNMNWVVKVKIQDFFRVVESDTVLLTAPLTNNFGVTLVLVALFARAKLSMQPDLNPDVLVETIERDGVTFFAGVPMLAQLLLRATRDQSDPLPTLRRVLMAGTPLTPDLAKEFEDRFQVELMNGYGLTEAVPLAFATDWKKVPQGSVGPAARETDIRICSDDMVDVPLGEIGEVLVRGPQVTPGYWNAPSLNAEAFHEGWYHTGDIGHMDESGNLYIVDRIKDIIKTAGYTVYPAEVENLLRTHPDVIKASVIGVPHKMFGEVSVAFIVLGAVDVQDSQIT